MEYPAKEIKEELEIYGENQEECQKPREEGISRRGGQLCEMPKTERSSNMRTDKCPLNIY